jgi:hypothetical protein
MDITNIMSIDFQSRFFQIPSARSFGLFYDFRDTSGTLQGHFRDTSGTLQGHLIDGSIE